MWPCVFCISTHDAQGSRVEGLLLENYDKPSHLKGFSRMYHGHELEELISSKCPYYPKQFIDSMLSLLKYN